MNNQSELEKYVKELVLRVETLEAKVEMLERNIREVDKKQCIRDISPFRRW